MNIKKILIFLLFQSIFINSVVFSQIFTDGFNTYTLGDLGTQGGWSPSNPEKQIQVESTTPLYYPEYIGSDGGNYLTIPQSSIGWSSRNFANQYLLGDLNLWVSFVIRINTNTPNGSYILTFRDIDNRNDGAMFYITQGKSINSIRFGVSKISQVAYSVDYSNTNEYLIVLKYANHPIGSDTMFLWVNPTLGLNEPNTASAIAFDASGSDPNWRTSISYIALIPSEQNVECAIDGFRLGTNWLDAAMPVKLELFTSDIIYNKVNLKWITSEEINNKGFEVIRNGTSIGWVNGKGNSNSQQIYTFEDIGLQTGIYNYELKQVDFNGNYTVIGKRLNLNVKAPKKILVDAYPNPFNPSTEIRYTILNNSKVKISLYDLNGKEVKSILNESREPGYYKEKINGSNLSSGIYFCKIVSKDFVKTLKLILLK